MTEMQGRYTVRSKGGIPNHSYTDFKASVHALKCYAYNEQYGIRGANRIAGTLCAALIKDQAADFQSVHEEEVTVSFEVPATWFDHLKELLPNDLKFGWLTPKYKTLSRTVTQNTRLTLNKYSVYVAPGGEAYVRHLTVCDPAPIDLRDWVRVEDDNH